MSKENRNKAQVPSEEQERALVDVHARDMSKGVERGGRATCGKGPGRSDGP